MSADEIAALSLTDVARKIREKELSSVEVTQASLDRIARHGDTLNCVAHVDPEDALSQARKADAALASDGPAGPLHGVPLAHKDMYYRAGRVSACGSKIRADFVPDITSTALKKLDAAGALEVARLQMVEFATGPTGHNEVAGTPRNPWNTDHITGGSSSGSGSAVAGRLVYGALGSDTGGSIRIPAYCNGLVGMKATYGRVSRYGAMPLSFSLDHVGPLCRTVTDCAVVTQAIAGYDPDDPTTSREPVGDYLADIEGGVKGLRIAVPANHFFEDIDDEVRAAIEASIEVYRKLGAEILEVEIPGIKHGFALGEVLGRVEAATYHSTWLRERPQDYGTQTRNRIMQGFYYPGTRYIEALNLRGQLLDRFTDAVFSVADMVIAPSVPMAVPTIEETDVSANQGFLDMIARFGSCTRPFNFLGLPALGVPCGFTSSGLPTGYQIVGRSFDEATLFRAARAFERETGCTERAPAL
jgi:aspartyl-tRNA(Asn)/glutamyl-tRNA(Gln) amidotransferase subunit A